MLEYVLSQHIFADHVQIGKNCTIVGAPPGAQ